MGIPTIHLDRFVSASILFVGESRKNTRVIVPNQGTHTMIILTNTETLTVVLSAPPATSNPVIYSSYFESNTSTGDLKYYAVTSLSLDGTTPVAVVGPTAKSWIARVLGAFNLVNTDTAPILLSLRMNGVPFLTCLLAVGDNLLYSRGEGAFKVQDSTGALKMVMAIPNVAYTNAPNTFAVVQTFSGLIVPSSAIGIQGTVLADSAQVGSIGENISATVPVGSNIPLTTVTTANVTSIALSAGDWDVDGRGCFTLASTTTMGYLSCGISAVSATMPLNNVGASSRVGNGTNATVDVTVDTVLSIACVRISIAAPTTVYLVARAKFATSTCRAYGTISARRVR
jgi:hypothetical protein